MNNLEHTLKEAREDFDQCQSVTDLDQAKAKYLGKSGVLTEALKSLGKLSAEERPKVGAEINVVKQGVEEALEKRRDAILNASQAKQLAEESLDVTLPSRKEDRGSLHPVTSNDSSASCLACEAFKIASRLFSSASSTPCLTTLISAPTLGLSYADNLPNDFSASVKTPLLPKYLAFA